jgi:asparagine synthase (glutamine-hydrolysing)
MCGIAGIIRFDDEPIEQSRALRMQKAILERGPDGSGVESLPHCTLVHTRLSIIDVFGGHQPMSIPAQAAAPSTTQSTQKTTSEPAGQSLQQSGQLHLVFNGEIYNHRSLRKQLEFLGHRFESSHCDTEVLLHGYRQWGTELPKRLHGMFAFAIWDENKRKLFLCRDRAGKKPLYIKWANNNREFMFASLVSSLVAGLPKGESPQINSNALLTYLRFGYTFEQSLLQGIEELPAAHWIEVNQQGQTTCERYWQPPPISRNSTSLGIIRSTEELIDEAVIQRLESDVPLGCFLSGGIDSSIIASIAQREQSRRGHEPLRTFCVKMPHSNYDESVHARKVAKHLGTHHTELLADPGDDDDNHVMADLEALIRFTGEPTADSSILPTFWLSRTTRKHVKVALSGDGGDELFGGYDRYRAMRILSKHRWWVNHIPTDWLSGVNPRAAGTRLQRLVRAAGLQEESARYESMIYLFNQEQLRELGLPYESPSQEMARLVDWPDEPDPAHAAMRWDLVHYLPFDLLRKVDRASMAVGLEVRCPLLDTQVCDLAGHLPTSVLMPNGKPKGLLRKVAASLDLPRQIVLRKKRGFALPIGEWFRGPLRQSLVQHILEGRLTSLGINRYAVERLIEEHQRKHTDHTHRLFALLMLSMWADWLETATGTN